MMLRASNSKACHVRERPGHSNSVFMTMSKGFASCLNILRVYGMTLNLALSLSAPAAKRNPQISMFSLPWQTKTDESGACTHACIICSRFCLHRANTHTHTLTHTHTHMRCASLWEQPSKALLCVTGLGGAFGFVCCSQPFRWLQKLASASRRASAKGASIGQLERQSSNLQGWRDTGGCPDRPEKEAPRSVRIFRAQPMYSFRQHCLHTQGAGNVVLAFSRDTGHPKPGIIAKMNASLFWATGHRNELTLPNVYL